MANQRRSNSGPITAARAARLYQLLKLLRPQPRSRAHLAKVLKIDLRGFYRDLRTLRGLGVRIAAAGQLYILRQPFERAVARLPFPDPRLNIHEALELSRGKTAAHRKLTRQLHAIIGE